VRVTRFFLTFFQLILAYRTIFLIRFRSLSEHYEEKGHKLLNRCTVHEPQESPLRLLKLRPYLREGRNILSSITFLENKMRESSALSQFFTYNLQFDSELFSLWLILSYLSWSRLHNAVFLEMFALLRLLGAIFAAARSKDFWASLEGCAHDTLKPCNQASLKEKSSIEL